MNFSEFPIPTSELNKLYSYPWFEPHMSKHKASRFLVSTWTNGAFLVRFSRDKNRFVLSVLILEETYAKVKHYVIQNTSGLRSGSRFYYLTNDSWFPSIKYLVKRHIAEVKAPLTVRLKVVWKTYFIRQISLNIIVSFIVHN
ncbi:hypothetical protein B4U79_18138 [Dinothrombium tinctorium]|uniref:SH2 domain-containing protein n=1 Tax=Dinothrombium tinctorium TaxID=1965070 RepID=A0A443QYE9_9ACAR|nr:hypothetical protein B4U79_18186 [Dinothrombium tinctorium]RWS09013.1 hypothetical protein B4U79_18138 [Dinothrombium tinctorium]